jgi:riboflavin kinase/FMN adenylyltransferase
VLDFEGDLRGRSVHLDFVARLRDELRFDGADELVAQMDRDVEETRVLLARAEEPGELLLQP